VKYLAVGCTFRDELPYLREWIEYHRLVGVERFYMYCDDDSPDAALRLLKPYIDMGLVVMAPFVAEGAQFVGLQATIYGGFVQMAANEVRWLACIDVDEFLLPVQADNVPEVLAPYERYAALAVNWACFGSSGLRVAPGLQTEMLRMRMHDDREENRGFKSIVDPARVVRPYNPHKFILADSQVLVDEYGAPVTGDYLNENTPFFGKRLRLNHYRIRSLTAFEDKVSRWRDRGHPELGSVEAQQQYLRRYDRNEVPDDTIQRFVPELRRRLGRASP
jgi:hypothetical protein